MPFNKSIFSKSKTEYINDMVPLMVIIVLLFLVCKENSLWMAGNERNPIA